MSGDHNILCRLVSGINALGKGGKRRNVCKAESHQAAQDKKNKHDIPPEWRRAYNPHPPRRPSMLRCPRATARAVMERRMPLLKKCMIMVADKNAKCLKIRLIDAVSRRTLATRARLASRLRQSFLL